MLSEQVTNLMRKALVSESKKLNISLKDIRVQIKLTEELDSSVCFALEKTKKIGDVKWNSILGIKAIAFKKTIINSITDRLHELAKSYDIDKEEINVRVYAIDIKGTPNMYLYNGNKPLKELEIKELI